MRFGSAFVYYAEQDDTDLLGSCCRCSNNKTSPIPYENYTGRNINSSRMTPNPTIKEYTRGNFYRDQEWVMPTYQPNYTSSTNELPDPRHTATIYWLNIRNMLYKIGYFKEEGNISTFVPCPIKKKRGQVFRCTFREHVGRHIAGA